MSSALMTSSKAVRKKLSSCRRQNEAWKDDHHQAMMVFDFQVLLGDVIECFRDIERIDKLFREKVRNTPNCFDFDFDQQLKKLCGELLEIGNDIEQQTLPKVLQTGHQLDNVEEFHRCVNVARSSKEHDFDLEAIMDRSQIQISEEGLDSIRTPMSEWGD